MPPWPSRDGSGFGFWSPTTIRSTARASCGPSRASGQVEIVAEAEDGRAALAKIQEHLPDVALLDYKLPELDGVAVTHAVVREQLPDRVLLVSAFTDSGVVYKALETGAAGFISKEARREQIVDAVLACARGENVVPPDVAAGLVSEIRLRKQDDTPALTPREQEILHLIAAGKSLPEIAKELFLGLTTVKTHVQHLYEKLGVSDRAAAVAERDAARPDRVAGAVPGRAAPSRERRRRGGAARRVAAAPGDRAARARREPRPSRPGAGRLHRRRSPSSRPGAQACWRG